MSAKRDGTPNWKRKATALGVTAFLLWMVLANLTSLRNSALGMTITWIVTGTIVVVGAVLLVPRRS